MLQGRKTQLIPDDEYVPYGISGIVPANASQAQPTTPPTSTAPPSAAPSLQTGTPAASQGAQPSVASHGSSASQRADESMHKKT